MSSERPLVTERVAEAIRRIRTRPLESDWFGVDPRGYAAFFVTNDHGVTPEAAVTGRVDEALEAQLRAAAVRRATTTGGDGYRGSAQRAEEPVFDPPRGPGDRPSHEARFGDYPHLVVTSDADALRPWMDDWGATEALARDAFAAIFPAIGEMTLDELHEAGVCIGCRVLDDPNDPRPRAPELLASAGLYVYAHVDDDPDAPYLRVASPSVPVDLDDLEPVLHAIAELVRISVPFEQARTIAVSEDLGLTEIARRVERERARQSRRPWRPR